MSNKLDDLIISATSGEWQKTAMVISKVFDNPDFSKDDNTAQSIAARISVLVDNGKLTAKGNIRRWRDSSVRLVG